MKNLIAPQLLAEFKTKPVPMAQIETFLDSNADISAATLCKLIDVPVQQFYNWRNEVKKKGLPPTKLAAFNVNPVSGGGKYSAEDKLALAKRYEMLEPSKRAELLRTYAIYQSDIKRWQEMADVAALESLGKRKIRSDKQSAETKMIESLKKDLLARDKKIEKLEILVTIQKKLSALLSESEST